MKQVSVVAAVIALTMGIAGGRQGIATTDTWPVSGPDSTEEGRNLWIANCATCHAYGIAGAPKPTIPSQWRERVAKPRDELYQNAIGGFFGPASTQMPARGGNPDLSDDEVRAAVDYMAEFALRTIKQSTSSEE